MVEITLQKGVTFQHKKTGKTFTFPIQRNTDILRIGAVLSEEKIHPEFSVTKVDNRLVCRFVLENPVDGTTTESTAFLDTGAQKNLISKSLARRLNSGKIKGRDTVISGVSGYPTTCKEIPLRAKPLVRIKNQEPPTVVDYFVIFKDLKQNLDHDLLIGLDLMDKIWDLLAILNIMLESEIEEFQGIKNRFPRIQSDSFDIPFEKTQIPITISPIREIPDHPLLYRKNLSKKNPEELWGENIKELMKTFTDLREKEKYSELVDVLLLIHEENSNLISYYEEVFEKYRDIMKEEDLLRMQNNSTELFKDILVNGLLMVFYLEKSGNYLMSYLYLQQYPILLNEMREKVQFGLANPEFRIKIKQYKGIAKRMSKNLKQKYQNRIYEKLRSKPYYQ